MNRAMLSSACAALILGGAYALADDSMSRTALTDQQMMTQCIEKQKTADVTMSKAEMKRFCRDQLKMQKATGQPAEPPPVDVPHN